MKIEEASFQNSKGSRIAARIYSAMEKSKKAVIFSHGLFSSKDSFKVQKLSQDIIDAGLTFFTFDFSFAGESEGNFESLSLLQEVDDLANAVKYCLAEEGMEQIHIIGSSMGGVVSLLYVAQTKEKISSLSIIATPFDLKEVLKRIANVEDVDSLPVNGMTDISGIFINNSFFKEAINIDLESNVKKIQIPILVIHGTSDELITKDSANGLYENIASEKKLVFIDSGDHTLSKDKDIAIIKDNILSWIQKNS